MINLGEFFWMNSGNESWVERCSHLKASNFTLQSLWGIVSQSRSSIPAHQNAFFNLKSTETVRHPLIANTIPLKWWIMKPLNEFDCTKWTSWVSILLNRWGWNASFEMQVIILWVTNIYGRIMRMQPSSTKWKNKKYIDVEIDKHFGKTYIQRTRRLISSTKVSATLGFKVEAAG
jgi:hypothetical protein